MSFRWAPSRALKPTAFLKPMAPLKAMGPGIIVPLAPLSAALAITGCFHNTTIISKENTRLDCYLLLKYCRRQCTLLPLTCAKSLTKFKPKMLDFKHVLDLNCKQKEDEQLNFFNWLSNVKNLVLSNGFEHVRNVIQWY